MLADEWGWFLGHSRVGTYEREMQLGFCQGLCATEGASKGLKEWFNSQQKITISNNMHFPYDSIIIVCTILASEITTYESLKQIQKTQDFRVQPHNCGGNPHWS